MLIGIDTFDTRLDMVDWPEFQKWNGGNTPIAPEILNDYSVPMWATGGFLQINTRSTVPIWEYENRETLY